MKEKVKVHDFSLLFNDDTIRPESLKLVFYLLENLPLRDVSP